MKYRLTHDEVIKACSYYASEKLNFAILKDAISERQQFIVTSQDGSIQPYENIEFEFEE